MKRLRDLVGLKRVAGGLKLALKYGLMDAYAAVPKMIENANAIADGESPGVTYGWDTAFINRDPEEPEHRGERATGSRKVRIEGHKGRAYPDEWPLYE